MAETRQPEALPPLPERSRSVVLVGNRKRRTGGKASRASQQSTSRYDADGSSTSFMTTGDAGRRSPTFDSGPPQTTMIWDDGDYPLLHATTRTPSCSHTWRSG